MTAAEFRASGYTVNGRRAILKQRVSPRDPAHTASKKPSQIRGTRAGGLVTIIVDERDVLP